MTRMGILRATGFVLGAVGNLLVGYTVYSMMSMTACSGASCEPNILLLAAGLPVGTILSVAGIFMAGFIVFHGLFLAIGVGALAAVALGNMPGMELFGWIFGGMFALSGLAPLLAGRAVKGVVSRKREDAAALIRTGVKAVGTVIAVRDTGITINDDPRVEIRMRVEPMDGSAAVERAKAVTVSRVAVPRPGERFPVWFDPADPSRWAYGTDMEESAAPDVKEMFAAAQGKAEPAEADFVGEIERLSALWKSGALTDREFADAKARLLERIGR